MFFDDHVGLGTLWTLWTLYGPFGPAESLRKPVVPSTQLVSTHVPSFLAVQHSFDSARPAACRHVATCPNSKNSGYLQDTLPMSVFGTFEQNSLSMFEQLLNARGAGASCCGLEQWHNGMEMELRSLASWKLEATRNDGNKFGCILVCKPRNIYICIYIYNIILL